MKKRVCVISLLLCAALLTACAAPAAEPGNAAPAATGEPAVTATPEPTATPIPPSTEPDPTASPEKNGAVDVEIHRYDSEDIYDETDPDIMLLSFFAELPVVTAADAPDVAAAINAALEEDHRLFVQGREEQPEYNISGKDAYLAAARSDLDMWREMGNLAGFQTYWLRRAVEAQRTDAVVLSLTYDDVTWTGGAHGYAFRTGVNFDARTGERLTLADITYDLDAFTNSVAAKLLEITGEHPEYDYYPGYEENLPGLVTDGGWYFSNVGLVIVANPENIARYADGRIEFVLPYSWLAGWTQINTEYFPRMEADGEAQTNIHCGIILYD